MDVFGPVRARAAGEMFALESGSSAHLLCARNFNVTDVVEDLLEVRGILAVVIIHRDSSVLPLPMLSLEEVCHALLSYSLTIPVMSTRTERRRCHAPTCPVTARRATCSVRRGPRPAGPACCAATTSRRTCWWRCGAAGTCCARTASGTMPGPGSRATPAAR